MPFHFSLLLAPGLALPLPTAGQCLIPTPSFASHLVTIPTHTTPSGGSDAVHSRQVPGTIASYLTDWRNIWTVSTALSYPPTTPSTVKLCDGVGIGCIRFIGASVVDLTPGCLMEGTTGTTSHCNRRSMAAILDPSKQYTALECHPHGAGAGSHSWVPPPPRGGGGGGYLLP